MIIYILLLNFIILSIRNPAGFPYFSFLNNSHIKSDIDSNAIMWDNDLILCFAPNISFHPPTDGKSGHHITHDQPYDGYTYKNHLFKTNKCMSEYTQITVKAGRKGSKDVATDFVEGIGYGHMMPTIRYEDEEPEELNFWIRVFDFRVNDIIIPEIYFAQGHIKGIGINNWWVGSKYLKHDNNIEGSPLYYKNKHGIIYFFRFLTIDGTPTSNIMSVFQGKLP